MPVIPLPIGANLLPDATTARGFRFRVHKLLGAGGFGITYLAKDAQLGDLCVVKEFALEALFQREQAGTRLIVVHGRESEHNHWLEKFFREARLLHHVRHEGAVTVRAVWRENNTAYFAMEFVDGIQLPAQPMPGVGWTTWEPVAKKFLIALGAIHEAGLSHGDIKPPNVLVRRDGQPTLIDFGTARAARDLEKTHLTALITSHGYSPPELSVRDRAKEVGPWSDLYSWAMTVMGLVVEHSGDGGAPLGATERLALFKHGVVDAGFGKAMESQLLAAGVPTNWTALLLRCVALDPAARPQSVAEAAAMLRTSAPMSREPRQSANQHGVAAQPPSATAPASARVKGWSSALTLIHVVNTILVLILVAIALSHLGVLPSFEKAWRTLRGDTPTSTPASISPVPAERVGTGSTSTSQERPSKTDASPAGSPDAGADEDAKSQGDVNQRSQADAEGKKKADAEAKMEADSDAKKKADAEAKKKADAEAKVKAGFPQTEGSPDVGSARRPKRVPTSEPEPEPEPEDPEFAAGEPLHPPAATSKSNDPPQGRTARRLKEKLFGTNRPAPAAAAPTTAPK